jgi:hypothetical protein
MQTMAKPAVRKQGRLTLGKITVQLRMRPSTKEKLWQVAAAEQITVSDYVEAVLIHHFDELLASSKRR